MNVYVVAFDSPGVSGHDWYLKVADADARYATILNDQDFAKDTIYRFTAEVPAYSSNREITEAVDDFLIWHTAEEVHLGEHNLREWITIIVEEDE